MKLTNSQILNMNEALQELVNERMAGLVKFKLFNIKKTIEEKLEIIVESIQKASEDELKEILEVEQEVPIPNLLSMHELEALELSIKQISGLDPVINYEEEQ